MDFLEFTHLLYVRKFSFLKGDYELFVFGVVTDDVFHTVGEMFLRSLESINRIDVVELTDANRQAKLDYWRNEGMSISVWRDIF